MPKQLIENVHYYLENGRVVFTTLFHLERGTCCGNKCRHCPFNPEWTKGTTKIKEKESEDWLTFD
jgi:hypothetical protein